MPSKQPGSVTRHQSRAYRRVTEKEEFLKRIIIFVRNHLCVANHNEGLGYNE